MKRLANEPVTLSTTEALRRLAKGPDDCAWTTVLDRHGVEILRATQRILGDPMSAEDACQETLLQIRDRAAQFRGRPGAPDTMARNWIMRIACNTALHMLRQRKRSRLREQNVAREAPQTTDVHESAPHANEELALRVRAELAELPEKQRLPLVLHFFAGLDYDQISSELRCGVGAARVRVHRALEKLRERMALLGIVVTTAALYTLLSSSTASASEAMGAVLDPERFTRWHGLLLSTQQAAINVVSDPGFPAAAKVGFAAAASAVCGTLAFTCGQKTPEKPSLPQISPAPLSVQSQKSAERETAIETSAQPQSAPRESASRESAATNIASKTELPREKVTAQQPAPDLTPVPQSRVPAEKHAATDKRTASRTNSRIASAAPHPDRSAYDPNEASDTDLASPLTQLEMLRMMQHELNVRVARIHEEIHTRGMITPDDQAHLRHAADDQAELSNLIRRIADEIRYTEQPEVRKASLDR